VVKREYEPWETKHVVIDTAGQTVEESIRVLEGAFNSYLKILK
jgi:hypothetical protein